MIRDNGDMAIEDANDMNIPVVCFLHEPDRENGLWSWSAINFMPRKEALGARYHIEADTKGEIVELVNKYVVPLYEAALTNLKKFGENYYWEQQ